MTVEIFLQLWKRNKIALAICLTTFVFQLLTLRDPVVLGEPYFIATNILHGLGFSYPGIGSVTPQLTCFIPPLYVWILVGIMKLGGGLVTIQIVNVLSLQAATFVIYKFSQRFLNETLARIALVAVSLYLPLWILAAAIEPNALNLLLLALTLNTLYAAYRSPSMSRVVLLGFLTGLQVLIRPDMLLGALLFAIWLFVVLRNRLEVRRRIVLIGTAALAALLCVAPWTVRNYVVFHRLILVSANSGFNLWIGNNPSASGEFELKPWERETEAQWNAIAAYSSRHNQVESDDYMWNVGVGWIAAHPVEVLVLDLKKVYFHWWRRAYVGGWVRVNDLMAYYVVGSLFLLTFGFYGLIRLKDPALRGLYLTLFLYSTLVSAIFFVQSRHRALKVDPFMLPLAVAGCYLLKERLTSRKQYLAKDEYTVDSGSPLDKSVREGSLNAA